jgi:catechol 2,3-dioxygenase-like lactoylglutathione lyase family enzyme
MTYAISLLHGMTVSLAEGGAGLGTGWGEQRALRLLSEAGFGHVEVYDAPGDPATRFSSPTARTETLSDGGSYARDCSNIAAASASMANMRDSIEPTTPTLRQVVLDCENARVLAEFYRQLLGFYYRSGDEPPADGTPDTRGQDWLVLCDSTGTSRLAFQQVAHLPEPTWPEGPRPQMLHLDTTVPTVADLNTQHQRALALGARLLLDRSDDEVEPLFVYADPAGHPFCIFVAPS